MNTLAAVTWCVTELAFTSTREYANPFADVEMTVVFRQGATEIRRPAFWDGGRTWKVRFAPTLPGEWTWQSTCTDAGNDGLHGRGGQLTATAYDGPHAIYRHGFLRVSDNRRYFVHADGTPFFWLGDTHWQMPDWERLDANNAPDAAVGQGQFHQLAEDRARKGFTVYQNYLTGHQTHWWRDKQFACIDPTRFREVMDPMMDHLAERGFVIAQGIGLYITAVKTPRESLVRLAKYVAARYGAHPLVWFTAQEVNLPDDPRTKQPRTDLDAWAAAAQAFSESNGYRHPVSGHLYPGTPTVWGQEPWHDWFALQGGHTGTGIRRNANFQLYWNHQPAKPFLETEAMYEQIICGPRKATERDVRISAWKSWLSGSYGYTYGAAAVWLLKWDKADKRGESYNPGTWWHAGMNLPGSTQMTHLKNFFTALDWWTLVPRFGPTEETVIANAGSDVFVLYSYGDDRALGTLTGLDAIARYRAVWFDPRTGKRRRSMPVAAQSGAWRIPVKPDKDDWVLLVAKERATR